MNKNNYLALKAMREYIGITRTEMAKKIKVSSPVVAKLEDRNGLYDSEILYRCIELFEITSFEIEALNNVLVELEKAAENNMVKESFNTLQNQIKGERVNAFIFNVFVREYQIAVYANKSINF